MESYILPIADNYMFVEHSLANAQTYLRRHYEAIATMCASGKYSTVYAQQFWDLFGGEVLLPFKIAQHFKLDNYQIQRCEKIADLLNQFVKICHTLVEHPICQKFKAQYRRIKCNFRRLLEEKSMQILRRSRAAFNRLMVGAENVARRMFRLMRELLATEVEGGNFAVPATWTMSTWSRQLVSRLDYARGELDIQNMRGKVIAQIKIPPTSEKIWKLIYLLTTSTNPQGWVRVDWYWRGDFSRTRDGGETRAVTSAHQLLPFIETRARGYARLAWV